MLQNIKVSYSYKDSLVTFFPIFETNEIELTRYVYPIVAEVLHKELGPYRLIGIIGGGEQIMALGSYAKKVTGVDINPNQVLLFLFKIFSHYEREELIQIIKQKALEISESLLDLFFHFPYRDEWKILTKKFFNSIERGLELTLLVADIFDLSPKMLSQHNLVYLSSISETLRNKNKKERLNWYKQVLGVIKKRQDVLLLDVSLLRKPMIEMVEMDIPTLKVTFMEDFRGFEETICMVSENRKLLKRIEERLVENKNCEEFTLTFYSRPSRK